VNEKTGFIGLGEMGSPMARNLLRAGYPTTVFDIVTERMEALAAEGAQAANSPADVGGQASLIITCLPGGEVVEEVVRGKGGVLEACRPGQVLVDTTTNYPPDSLRLSETLAASGVAMLDAPVSGGPEGAAAGTLSIMVGGRRETFERCRPLLEQMGSRISLMGETVGAGGYAKLANQIMVYINLVSVAEALAYAERVGLELPGLLPALEAGHANSVLLQNKGAKIAERDWSPVGPVWMGYKDLSYVVKSMDEMGFSLPFIPQVRSLLKELVDDGKEGLDQAAVFEILQRKAGAGR
jgi:3-hydroxyisobutyrate dehydrogenase-like beta-hydroxyacid dehydrogenase